MEKFLKEYERIKGKTFYKIMRFPTFETKIEKGGCDHLGLLPDKETRVVTGFEYKILEFKVNPANLKELVEGTYYLDREDAERALLNMPKRKPEVNEIPCERYNDIEWILKQLQERGDK